MTQSKQLMEALLTKADVRINGDRPWDMQVHNERLYHRVLAQGSLGLGEAYMDGWWDCDQLDEFATRVLRAQLDKAIRGNWRLLLHIASAQLMNRQRTSRAFEIGKRHYDIGNDLYERMLDKRMTYTCGYWNNAASLDEAQEAKLDLVCRKIGLKKGDRVLDIGCGWGSFAKFAAETYGAEVVGVTVSKEQIALGRKRCVGLPIDLRLQDYRKINESFDHIVSLGMFEHVGVKNYRTYMEVAHRCLKDDGLFLLHTIGRNTSGITTDPWIDKYIFPNSLLPSIAQIATSVERLFVMEDWHNFSTDYDKTLMAWWKNVETHWGELAQQQRYDERFHRMWRYYLLMCAGTFRARTNQLWQIVLSKHGVPGGYRSRRG